ncbi:hypothetical protein GFB56_35595 [Ensifer sp. T173]|uniref:Uncharacterized protein n=1 Tax=Ensifer canadensis TaxID=555315 RepID=A0AAW4FX87_9HYPH|nr:hypothetical protein [Ensifer sp. ENS11]MBM3095895.1 hypothetical protein [Ensifer canadensis]PSS61536.1 hypothetical protein C6558_27830 [Ensifer sp. NM-2]MBM3096002.1 hypothetical protein [Ensifer canadensis]NOV20683.1 hypothetical protein [Ensifer canadensis]
MQCQEAITDEFQFLIERIEAAGWSPEEASSALIELAENHYLSINAEAEMFELGAGVVLIAPKPH